MLVADGAWGTELSRRGLPSGDAPEKWNLDNPNAVEAVASAYVSAGGDPAKEIDDMKWLAEKVASYTEQPLCYDSPNPEVIKTGLDICNREGTIINSVTDESGKKERVLEIVKQYNAWVIALTMDDNGMAEDLDKGKGR